MKVISDDDPRLKFVPLEQAIIPPSGLIEHIKDRWWAVHPNKGLIFWGKGQSPQCNSNKDIAERIFVIYPWAEVKFIPSVFRQINPNDYVD